MHFQFSSSATDGYCPGIFWKPNPSYKLLSFCPFHVMLTNFHISAYILQNSYKLKININQRGFPKKNRTQNWNDFITFGCILSVGLVFGANSHFYTWKTFSGIHIHSSPFFMGPLPLSWIQKKLYNFHFHSPDTQHYLSYPHEMKKWNENITSIQDMDLACTLSP